MCSIHFSPFLSKELADELCLVFCPFVRLERHMEMTQGFIVLGKNPGLFVLGEPTHDREAHGNDTTAKTHRNFLQPTVMKPT